MKMTKPIPLNTKIFFTDFDDPVLQAKVDEIQLSIFMNRQGEMSLGVDFVSQQHLTEEEIRKLRDHFEQNFDTDLILFVLARCYNRREMEQKEKSDPKQPRGDAR